MSDSLRLSHRAVAASAAFLLTGVALGGPALAEEGRGRKGGGDRGASASQGRSQGSAQGAQGQAGAGAAGAGAQDSGDPAGNNGTFKVDGLPDSDGMANEPHVPCGFRLRFFGFDEGQTGDITIAGHAPSGSGVVNERSGVLLSDDAAGGGPNDVDAVVTYVLDDLDLSGLEAHPQQGYHLKVSLATDTPGGQKHKVFWLEPCETTPTVGGTTVTVPTTPVVTDVDGVAQDRTDVLGTTVTGSTGSGTPDTSVLGVRLTRPGALPFTGSLAELLLALGGGLLVLGGAAVAAGRRS